MDDEKTAFPASEKVPGQAESRSAYQSFVKFAKEQDWWDDYLAIRKLGYDYRKAAYIVWSSLPTDKRQPPTKKEFANLIGLKDTSVIRKWRSNNPEIDKLIENLTLTPLREGLSDVIQAWYAVARSHDAKSFQDRKLYLEHQGIIKAKKGTSDDVEPGENDSHKNEFSEMSDDELEQFISNMQSASK